MLGFSASKVRLQGADHDLDGLERLAGGDQNAWGEVLANCTSSAEDETVPVETRHAIWNRMGQWYVDKLKRPDLALSCFQTVVESEPADEVVSHAKQHGLAFPLMKDPENKVADLYDARHTPEIFVVDPQGKLRYHGRIDENYEDPAKVASPDLKNALDAMLVGKAIARAETKAFGCSIKRV